MIEEIAALALAAEPEQRTESSSQTCEAEGRYGTGAATNDMACRKACPQEYVCNQPCNCPVHGFYMPAAAQGESSVPREYSQPIDEEESECMDGEDTGIVTEPSQSQTRVSLAPSATTNGTYKGKGSECSCCHCQAMRDKQNCLAIATMDQARGQCSCSELVSDTISIREGL